MAPRATAALLIVETLIVETMGPASPVLRPILIFAQGRSGSTLLCDLLDSHPSVRLHGEALESPLRLGMPPAWRLERLRWRSPRHVAVVHVKIYQLSGVHGIDDAGPWLRSMHRRGWRIIWLQRRNQLRQFFSTFAAFRRGGQFVDRGDAAAGVTRSNEPLHIDVDELLSQLALRAAALAAERRAVKLVPHLRLVYEDDLAEADAWPETMRRVAEFAGLSLVAPLRTNLRRQNPGALPDLIGNYAEVVEALRDTPWESDLT